MKSSTDDSHAFSKPFDDHPHSTIPNTINTTFPPHIFVYEPTSVLDPHLLPPPSSSDNNDNDDDWDPVSWLLADATDSPSSSSSSFDHTLYPHYPSSTTNDDIHHHHELITIPPDPVPPPLFDRNHLDLLLLRAADCVQANDPVTAHAILARLNYAASSSSALHCAALHFRDALLPIPNPPSASPPPSPLHTLHRITAHKSFSDLSPLPHFTTFTANQTLLESLLPLPLPLPLPPTTTTTTTIHVIDFDLGLGGQWSSFVQDVRARTRSLRSSPPALRITAVVPDEDTAETALAAENLRDFARAAGVRLSVDLLRAPALAGVRLPAAEPLGVVLSPAAFRLLGGSPESSAAALLRFVRRAAPRVLVLADAGRLAAPGGASLRRSLAAGLELYSAVLESLDAAAAASGVGEEPVGRVERSVLRPRIFSAVSAWAPREASDWRELLAGAGMAPVPFSEFTESQAEWLLRRAPAEGFHVARREGSLTLSWKGRELAATSAWRC